MSDNEEFLTTVELAARWKVTPETIRQQRFKNKGPRYSKPTGEHGPARYRLDDIIAWENKTTVGGEE